MQDKVDNSQIVNVIRTLVSKRSENGFIRRFALYFTQDGKKIGEVEAGWEYSCDNKNTELKRQLEERRFVCSVNDKEAQSD